jgi:hypothetical protein
MSWLAPDGTVLDKMPVNKYVSKEGEFIAPYRLPNESQKDYNKRYTDAQIASGLYPRTARASTVGARADERFVKLNDLKIEKVNSQIEKLRIAAKNDPSQAYNLTNAINRLQIQSNKLNDIKLTDKRYTRHRDREDLKIQESQKEATEFNAGAADRQRKAENEKISAEYRAEQANKDPWSVDNFLNKDSLLISSNNDGTYISVANRPQTQETPNPTVNASTASTEAIQTNNSTDVPDTSTVEKNLSNDGIPMKKHWIESVRDVEDGVTNYKNSEEYRRLLTAKQFASKKKLEIPKKKDKKKNSVTA